MHICHSRKFSGVSWGTRLEKDSIQFLDIACRGCTVMEMEGMMVLLEEGVRGMVGVEEA